MDLRILKSAVVLLCHWNITGNLLNIIGNY